MTFNKTDEKFDVKKIFPLTPLEESLEIMNSYSGTGNIITTSCIKGVLTEKKLRKTLDYIQIKHPRLQLKIIRLKDCYYFSNENSNKIPLYVVKNQAWKTIVLEEVNKTITQDSCLIRVTLAISEKERLSYIITTIHHAISDSISTIFLHKDILTCIQQIEENNFKLTVLPLIPKVEENLPASMKGWRGKIKTIVFIWKYTIKDLWFKPSILTCEKNAPIHNRRCYITHRQIDEKITQKLVAACRKNNTTVHAALCASILLSVFHEINPDKSIIMNCSSSVDLRRRLKPVLENEHLGEYASVLETYHTVGKDTDFWKLAQNVKKEIEQELKTNNLFSVLLVAKKIVKSFFDTKNIYKKWSTVEVINAGKIEFPKNYGNFMLEDINLCSPIGAFNNVFSIAIVTYNKKMLINFQGSTPYLSEETVERLSNNTLSHLFSSLSE